MKNQILVIILISLSLTACTVDKKEVQEKEEQRTEEVVDSQSLNDYMLVFGEKVDKYVANNEKNLKDLEELHLAFVPILKWVEFAGNEEYKKDALAAGQIVHKMEDAEGEKYQELFNSLKPAFIEFYAKYGESKS